MFRASIVILACFALAGCQRNTKITKENYDKILPDMTLAEVEALLGAPGVEDPELNLAEGSSVAGAVGIGGDLQSMAPKQSAIKWYRWGNSSRYIQVAFLQGKVMAGFNSKRASEGLP